MQHFKKFLLAGALLFATVAVVSPVSTRADTIQDQINVVMKQIQDLQAKLAKLVILRNSIPQIYTPTTGAKWQIGTVYAISWSLYKIDQPISIYLTGGGHEPGYAKMIGKVNAGTYRFSYAPTIDDLPVTSTDAWRIAACNGIMLSDISNCGYSGQIYITPKPTIVVTSPNGGEVWQKGSKYLISWRAANFSSLSTVTIVLDNNNSYYTTIAYGVLANSGSYSWTPSTYLSTGSQYKIRIYQGSVATDSSDNYFSLSTSASSTAQPSIAVLSPNNGETWKAGETHAITWASSGLPSGASAYINLIDNTSGTGYPIYSLTAYPVPGSAGSYSWTIPATIVGGKILGNQFKVAVYAYFSGGSASDSSDNYFSIVDSTTTQPSITVTSPNGGEQWAVGTTQNIAWTISDASTLGSAGFVIDLLNSSGSTVYGINSVLSSARSYSWAIPSSIPSGTPIISGQYKIRVRTPGQAIEGISNIFTINASTAVIVNTGLNVSLSPRSPISRTILTNYKTPMLIFDIANQSNSAVIISQINLHKLGIGNTSIPFISLAGDTVGGNSMPIITTLNNISFSIVSFNNLSISIPANTIFHLEVDASVAGENGTTFGLSINSSTDIIARNSTSSVSAAGQFPISGSISAISSTIPTITVTSPKGGENLAQGGIYNIAWTSNGVQDVCIFAMDSSGIIGYSVNDCMNNPIAASSGSYAWKVGYSSTGEVFSGNNFKIKVLSLYNNPGTQGYSSSFNITASDVYPSITFTSPIGGEVWGQGKTHNITWQSTGMSSATTITLSLQLTITSTSGVVGTTTFWIATYQNNGASVQNYLWNVPLTTNSNQYNILINYYDSSGQVIFGARSNYFSILSGGS